jgi:hypothetical protein
MGKTQQTIEVTVDEDGSMKVEASGFTGSACLKATKTLEEAIGLTSKRTMKSEAHKGITIADKTKVGG